MASLLDVMLHDWRWLRLGITTPNVEVPHAEINLSIILWVMTNLQFHGNYNENPVNFLRNAVTYEGVHPDSIRLLLIPFALGGKANEWLDMLPPGTIATMEDFLQLFVKSYNKAKFKIRELGSGNDSRTHHTKDGSGPRKCEVSVQED
ncbi:myb-like protein D [Gossypium australe]|uniref:Myb-like protein D n=1 Tax=Gossypium australe TaxID=47621 RepID=A0A5B6WPA9_9ROSI|nr:myb-like protein D [Gossypium australe]